MALFLVFLGNLGGIGYQIERIKELSFIRYDRFGYADANFTFSGTYNPLLHPIQWITGNGHVASNYFMIYLPHSYQPGEFGAPNYGLSPEDRYGNYISFAMSGNFLVNLVVFLALTLTLEVMKWRVLYLAMFAGIAGFVVAGIYGTVVGAILGALSLVYLLKAGYSFPLSGLRGHIIKRAFYSFMLVIAVISVDFIIFMQMPSNPMDFFYPRARTGGVLAPPNATIMQQIRDMWAVGHPLVSQYVTYVRNLLSWNFGDMVPLTLNQEVVPITQNLAERLPHTVFLLGTATLISIALGLFLGLMAIKERHKGYAGIFMYPPTFLASLPAWWVGLSLIMLFGVFLGLGPSGYADLKQHWAATQPSLYTANTTYTSEVFRISFDLNMAGAADLIGGYMSYAILPICTLVITMVGPWVLLVRGSLLQTLEEDYVVTAKAKGISDWGILTKHALRNACLPVVTSAAISFGFIIGGSVMVETVFGFPGIGSWLLDSVKNLDTPVLMVLFYAIGVCVIVANTIADLLYVVLDPRIKAESS